MGGKQPLKVGRLSVRQCGVDKIGFDLLTRLRRCRWATISIPI
jgi:hypothetical protein